MDVNLATAEANDLVRQGFAALAQDQTDAAQALFENALTRLRYPGDVYLDTLSRIHRHVKPRTYVEIGVSQGASLARALPEVTACVGIDPHPLLKPEQAARSQIFKLHSDEFFAQHNLNSVLKGVPRYLGFIDGHHVFEAALEDFCNLERFCTPDSTLIFHDCVPFSELTAARKRSTAFWTGDVWRVIPVLAHFRPDLSITVVRSPPSGLGIVRGLNPKSDVMARKFSEALAGGLAMGFDATQDFESRGVKVISSAWSEVERAFA